MGNYARIINNTAVDVSTDPGSHFHPDIVKEFTEVPDDVRPGYLLKEGQWLPPKDPETPSIPEPSPVYPRISPVEFKMLFTSPERVALRKTRDTNPVVADFFDIIEDLRLTHVDLSLKSVQDMVKELAALELIKPERIQQILTAQSV